MRKIYLLGLLYVGLSLVYLMTAPETGVISDGPPATITVPDDPPFTVIINVVGGPDEGPVEAMDAPSWFRSIKPFCNPVEVDTRLTWSPAPRSADGTAYEAACLALAGRIDSARERILHLPEDQRWNAAGVVFNVAHPVADGGRRPCCRTHHGAGGGVLAQPLHGPLSRGGSALRPGGSWRGS